MMDKESRTILVEPGSELADLVAEASTTPVLLEKDGIRYRLVVEDGDDIWTDYDPDKVVAVLDKLAGSLSDEDADKLIAAIYEAREGGSRPSERP